MSKYQHTELCGRHSALGFESPDDDRCQNAGGISNTGLLLHR